MIIQEEKIINGKTFLHTYSNEFVLEQVETGQQYDEAYDIIPCKYTYKETDIELPTEEDNKVAELNE